LPYTQAIKPDADRSSGRVAQLTAPSSRRVTKTPEQIKALEDAYTTNTRLTSTELIEFSTKIGLTRRQICSWFSTKRHHDKKVALKEEPTEPSGAKA
jgi:hypothetical protein